MNMESDKSSSVYGALCTLQTAIGDNAKAHGFHEGVLNIPEKIALIHSEASEALECYREIKIIKMLAEPAYAGTKPVGFISELADVVIRCFDTSYIIGGDLGKVILEKMAYNETRPYRHGNKNA